MSQPNITLTPAQKKIATNHSRFRVVNAGRRFGKTVLSVEEMVSCAVVKKDARIAYVAPTYQQARDISWDLLIKRTEGIRIKTNESRLEITVSNMHKGESKIVLRGWESIDNLRGQAFDLLVLDEVAMMRHFFAHWQEVLRPTLTDRKGMTLFISTPKGFNHFYDLYNTDQPDWQSFHFTSYDNPTIDREEINAAKHSMPEDAFSQEYMADFRKQSGLVYKEFRREIHVTEDKPKKVVHRYGALDFGFNNPAALLDIEIDDDNVYWVTAEWYKTGQTHEQIAELAAEKRYNAVYPDPEEAAGIETLRRKQVNVREVTKGKGSVVAGIDRVRELLKQNRLRVHKSCQHLISEFEMYAYEEEKTGTNRDDLPVKENDHALDALRYVVMMTLPKTTVKVPYLRLHKKLANPAL